MVKEALKNSQSSQQKVTDQEDTKANGNVLVDISLNQAINTSLVMNKSIEEQPLEEDETSQLVMPTVTTKHSAPAQNEALLQLKEQQKSDV